MKQQQMTWQNQVPEKPIQNNNLLRIPHWLIGQLTERVKSYISISDFSTAGNILRFVNDNPLHAERVIGINKHQEVEFKLANLIAVFSTTVKAVIIHNSIIGIQSSY